MRKAQERIAQRHRVNDIRVEKRDEGRQLVVRADLCRVGGQFLEHIATLVIALAFIFEKISEFNTTVSSDSSMGQFSSVE